MRIIKVAWLLILVVFMVGCCTAPTVPVEDPTVKVKPLLLAEADVKAWISGLATDIATSAEGLLSEKVTVGDIYEFADVVTVGVLNASGLAEKGTSANGSGPTWGAVVALGFNAGKNGLILSGVFYRELAHIDRSSALALSLLISGHLTKCLDASLSDGALSIGEIVSAACSSVDVVVGNLGIEELELKKNEEPGGSLLLRDVLDVAESTITDAMAVFQVLDVPLVVVSESDTAE